MTDPATQSLDLDEIRATLSGNGIDGPDLPYNPRALAAMRAADQLLAEVERLREELGLTKAQLALTETERVNYRDNIKYLRAELAKARGA